MGTSAAWSPAKSVAPPEDAPVPFPPPRDKSERKPYPSASAALVCVPVSFVSTRTRKSARLSLRCLGSLRFLGGAMLDPVGPPAPIEACARALADAGDTCNKVSESPSVLEGTTG